MQAYVFICITFISCLVLSCTVLSICTSAHLYTFGGELYHQKSGAPIGERGSVGTCRIILNFVDREVQEKLVAIKNAPILAFRYLDDVRKMLKRIKLGWRWVKGSMVCKRAWEQEEAAAGLTPTHKTATELKKIYESVYTELKFEMETAEDFESQTLPTLDFQCWMESDKLLYKFFRKPMSKQTLIMKESALSENIKISSLTQEVIRLSKNTSEQTCPDTGFFAIPVKPS